MPSNVWGEIKDTLPNFNDAVVEVWEWICNFIEQAITRTCGGQDLRRHKANKTTTS